MLNKHTIFFKVTEQPRQDNYVLLFMRVSVCSNVFDLVVFFFARFVRLFFRIIFVLFVSGFDKAIGRCAVFFFVCACFLALRHQE